MIEERKSYVCYTVTGESVFPVPFALASDSRLAVTVRHDSGVSEDLAEDADWTYDAPTRQVEVKRALAQGDTLVIRRVTPASNATALYKGRPINPDTLNLQNDKAMAAIQEVRDVAGRAVVAPEGDGGQVTLPPAGKRAGQILQWDDTGTGFEPLTKTTLVEDARAAAHNEVLEYTPIMSTYMAYGDFPQKGADGRLYCDASTDYVYRYSAADGRYHQITTDMTRLAEKVPTITYSIADSSLVIGLGITI